MRPSSITFRPRAVALDAQCAVGVGLVARALVERLLGRDDQVLRGLRGLATEDTVLLLGDEDLLPWVDGAFYLGCDPAAPRLLLPTRHRPDVPLALFERALLRQFPDAQTPLAVLPEPPRLISMADARPVERVRLSAWLEVHA